MATEKRLIDAIEVICSMDAELEAVFMLLEQHKKKHSGLSANGIGTSTKMKQ